MRGISIHRDKAGERLAWHWRVKGARWDYRLSPTRGLWREGIEFTLSGGAGRLLCVDDAVLYSLGFEEAALADLQRGPA